jgi:hypothetical protein
MVGRENPPQNVQVIDPELAKQAQDFGSLRRIPSDQNATVVPWLISNSIGLSPPFLMKLALRLWESDQRDSALPALQASSSKKYYEI